MSQVIVLDTHIWFWFITQDFARFPNSWRNKIGTATQVNVSPVSCYEIALAEQRGRLELPCPATQWFEDALVLPLTAEIACHAVKLTAIHRDPFDRLIIATALVHEAQLASVDSLFPQYPELKDYLMN